MSFPLSSNHYSTDDQIADVISFLSATEDYFSIMEVQFLAEFPEYNDLEWSGSWVDTESSNVDLDYMMWVAEWLENNTPVFWEEGEPFMAEPSDPTDDDL